MHASRLPWASLIDCIVIQINELGACSAGSAQAMRRPGGPSNWICTFIFFFHRLSSCAAAGFDNGRRGQRKSVYYCPTRLYPNKCTPIPYPLHDPSGNLPSARHKRSSASHVFAIEQHLPKPVMERHSHTPTSSQHLQQPIAYRRNIQAQVFPKHTFLYRLQYLLTMAGSRQQVPRALPSGIG